MGREALDRDSLLYQELLTNLELSGFEIIFDPMDRIRFSYQKVVGTKPFPGKYFLLPLFRAMYVLFRQGQWRDFICYLTGQISALEFRTRVVNRFIETIQPHVSRLVVLTRSAGSLVISKIANQLPVDQIICLGYPFKHPEEGDADFRTIHLAKIQIPMLIFQGLRDPYGGKEVRDRYVLSDFIQFKFLDVDHDFVMSEMELKLIQREMEEILTSLK